MLKKITILLLCMALATGIFAQTPKLDSLKQVLVSIKIDSTRATKMSIIAKEMLYWQPEEGVKWLYQGLALAKKSNGVTAISNLYNSLADYHYLGGNVDSSYYYTLQCIKHNKKYAQADGIALGYCSLARYYGDRGELVKSIEKYKEALELFPNTKETEHFRMGAYIGIGDAYFRYGAYDAALKAYQDSYKIPNAIKNEEHHATTTNSIGQVHFKLKNYEKAMDYTLRSLKMLEKQGYTLAVGISLFNIGEIMFATNHIDSALIYNERALKMVEGNGYPAGVADCERLYGDIAMRKKEFGKAEKYYASAANNFAEQGLSDRQTAVMVLQAKALTALGQYEAADRRLQETLDILSQKKSLQELADCYKALRDNASKKGNFKTTQRYTALYDEAYENYLGERKIAATVNSEVKLQVELKEAKIQNQSLALGQKNRNISILVLVLILMAITFIAATFYLRNKAQKEKEAARKEINELDMRWRKGIADEAAANTSKEEITLPQTITLNTATLYLDKIYYIESQDNYTVFYGQKEELHREVRTLRTTAKQLREISYNFKQIQRSYIVNEDYVVKSSIVKQRKKFCRLDNGIEIPTSDKYESLENK